MARPVMQEMPPPGGFPKVQVEFRPTMRGPSTLAIWGGVILMMTYGWVQIGRQNRKTNLETAEKLRARRAIYPFLQAEEDLRFVKARQEGLVPKNVYNTPGLW
eukprot:CAMPEP_0114342820 /NCGR_PEP_ID=MMETSP0101-20121206/10100_1 /TAXON_ID=38822 ORGANISM="Pteridomonas danica, Strain PT" /NCGR_SAMPLE_ID=MMETSP0101 /ASSEMBLY_ACC=CAM_ASM_000211 /LENGTH=102 /DNA_ID=CAMNT_0001477147 /DNA_START=27 /DNA_END=332 /DNA_ORIENTATION=+